MDDIQKSADYRLRHELKTENPPREHRVNGKTIRLSDTQWKRVRDNNIAHNQTVKKSVEREVRGRRVAAADNQENMDRANGSTSPKVWCPDVQESDMPAPFCARFSERFKNRLAVIVVFLPVTIIVLLALIFERIP